MRKTVKVKHLPVIKAFYLREMTLEEEGMEYMKDKIIGNINIHQIMKNSKESSTNYFIA